MGARVSTPDGPRQVLVDARYLDASGIGRYLREVLRRLVSTQPQVRFTAVVAPGKEALLPAGVAAVPWSAPMYGMAGQGPFLRRLAARHEVTWYPHYVHPLWQRSRMVVTVHDVIHVARPEWFPGWKQQLFARTQLRDVQRRAAATCFVSAFSRDEFTRLIGAPRGGVFVTANGVDPGWATAADQSRPVPWPYLVAVGNHKPHKNLVRLLLALEQLPEAPRLVLVGKRDGFITGDEGLAAALARLGERVFCTGHVDEAALAAWVGHAELLVFPSLYEGFGLPPLEAMTAGVPVVASRIPPVVEVCGDAMELVDPLDPADIARGITAVLTDDAYRQRLIVAGRQRAGACTWEATAAATWQALLHAVKA